VAISEEKQMNEQNIEARKYVVAPWFQVIVCVGILAISVASATYTWRTWHVYGLERRAAKVCKSYVEIRMPGYIDLKDATTKEDIRKGLEAWMARRACINQVMVHSSSMSSEAK
jgi:hypothetical protein